MFHRLMRLGVQKQRILGTEGRLPQLQKSMPKSKGASKSKTRQGTHAEEEVARTPSSIIWAKDGAVFLTVHVKPGAKRNCITEVSESHIGIQITAPAQEGEANVELVRTIARVVGVRKSAVSIDQGQRSRNKRVKISDVDKDMILEILQSNVGQSV